MPSASLLAYVGPESILPLTSVLAAIGGVVMMFWSRLRAGLAACGLRWRKSPPPSASESPPVS